MVFFFRNFVSDCMAYGYRREIVRFLRYILRTDRRIIANYFKQHDTIMIHIGAGTHVLANWLNVDLLANSSSVAYLNAARPFPFKNGAVDRIFSEHMIEHLSYLQGQAMLTECNRILRVGGRIRITTPNLAFLFDLYQEGKSSLQNDYIKWSVKTFQNFAPTPIDTFVINNFFHDWGHRFIYDEKVLRKALSLAGFEQIVRKELMESEDERFKNLECPERLPEGFLKLESLTLEATKKTDRGPIPL